MCVARRPGAGPQGWWCELCAPSALNVRIRASGALSKYQTNPTWFVSQKPIGLGTSEPFLLAGNITEVIIGLIIYRVIIGSGIIACHVSSITMMLT